MSLALNLLFALNQGIQDYGVLSYNKTFHKYLTEEF